MRQFTAKNNDDGVRLSRFIARVTDGFSGGAMHKAFRNRRIKVNGKRAGAEYRLQEGDTIELYINDEFFPDGTAAASSTAGQETAPIVAEWQDENLAVLYKPAGVLCHSDSTHDIDLATSFVRHLAATGEYGAATSNGFSPALCNRLDRGTEGLVLAAKRYPALRDVNAAIGAGLVHKTYLCITAGKPPEGRHEAYLHRDMKTKASLVRLAKSAEAKPIATGIKVLESKNGLSLCEIQLFTGRTHQIRAHLRFFGAPLLGDKRYGNPAANKRYPLQNQALCAWRLRFDENLPQQSSIRYLAGREFTAKDAQLLKTWETITKE